MGNFFSNIQKGFNDNIVCPFYNNLIKPAQDTAYYGAIGTFDEWKPIFSEASYNAPTLMLVASPPPSKNSPIVDPTQSVFSQSSTPMPFDEVKRRINLLSTNSNLVTFNRLEVQQMALKKEITSSSVDPELVEGLKFVEGQTFKNPSNTQEVPAFLKPKNRDPSKTTVQVLNSLSPQDAVNEVIYISRLSTKTKLAFLQRLDERLQQLIVQEPNHTIRVPGRLEEMKALQSTLTQLIDVAKASQKDADEFIAYLKKEYRQYFPTAKDIENQQGIVAFNDLKDRKRNAEAALNGSQQFSLPDVNETKSITGESLKILYNCLLVAGINVPKITDDEFNTQDPKALNALYDRMSESVRSFQAFANLPSQDGLIGKQTQIALISKLPSTINGKPEMDRARNKLLLKNRLQLGDEFKIAASLNIAREVNMALNEKLDSNWNGSTTLTSVALAKTGKTADAKGDVWFNKQELSKLLSVA